MEENKNVENVDVSAELKKQIDELNKQIKDLTNENGKLKNATTSASADASKYKKALAEKQTEQERLDAARAEESERIMAELNALKHEKVVSDNKASFLSVGYPAELAETSAQALAEGKFSFDDLKKFIDIHDKEITAKTLSATPKPNGSGSPSHSITKEQFGNMGYADRLKLFTENPELYKELNE